jgi:hypothetical protein
MVRLAAEGAPQPHIQEEGMTFTRFDEPVLVLVGLSYPRQIEQVGEAYALLSEWPLSKRDAAHALALEACKSALAEEMDAAAARAAFTTFARRHCILAPGAAELFAANATGALPDRPAA